MLEVRVGDVALRVGPGDKAILDVFGKGHTPQDRVGFGAAAFAATRAGAHIAGAGNRVRSGEPDPTGAVAGGVMVSVYCGSQRDKFVQPRGAVQQVMVELAEIIQDELDGGGEGNAGGGIGVTGQGILQDGEKARSTWESEDHTAELAQELLPVKD